MNGKPLDTSSGDPLADRRADYAAMLAAEGAFAAAAEVMLGAMELAPGWAFGWFRLGELEEAAGRAEAAERAWRTALSLDPADHAGAALKLALAGGAPAPDHPPSAFVETLFDQYAPRFDKALVEGLHYRAPDLLFAAIRRAQGGRFGSAADLGCGTGLMGERLRAAADDLTGYDISAAMLGRARAKGVYDRLEKADLRDLPFAVPGGAADLVTAADVFMYVGRLEGAFAGVRAMLAPRGLFAFSVESLGKDGDVRLRDTRRYAHGEGYVTGLLGRSGFGVVSAEREVIRRDRDAAVEGLIVVARAG